MPRSPYESALEATKIFRTFEEGDPDLVDIGIPAVTRTIGGMFPGNLVGIGAGQNVGKSSLILSMGIYSKDQGGVISLEDGEDVWGARLLARHSDIGPDKIRRKDLTDEEKERLLDTLDRLQANGEEPAGPWIEYRISESIESVEEAVEALAKKGCRWVVLDYLQKVRGHNKSDRRNEVGETLGRFQRACAKAEVVPVVMSQLVRLMPGKEPYPGHMKESGDIENECRLIVLLWRDPQSPLTVRAKVAKSSFGKGGLKFKYRFTEAEYLVEERGDEVYDHSLPEPEEDDF